MSKRRPWHHSLPTPLTLGQAEQLEWPNTQFLTPAIFLLHDPERSITKLKLSPKEPDHGQVKATDPASSTNPTQPTESTTNHE